jgi:hypothetical protein
MENTDKSGPEGAWTAPEGAGRDAPKTAEASGEAPPPPALPPPAPRLSGRLAALAGTAKDFARSAREESATQSGPKRSPGSRPDLLKPRGAKAFDDEVPPPRPAIRPCPAPADWLRRPAGLET